MNARPVWTVHEGGRMSPDLLPLLQSIPWLKGLSEPDQRQIAGLADRLEFFAGEAVLIEGQQSERLFFVEQGELEVLKHDGDAPLAVLRAGDGFGDLSFVDDLPVSASVVARQDAVVWTVSRLLLERRGKLDLLYRLTAAVGALTTRRLRQQNEALVRSLQARLAAERLRIEAAWLLGLIVLLLGMQQAASVIVEQAGIDVRSTAYRWGMLVLFMTPTLAFARLQGNAWTELGLTLRGVRRSLREAAGISAALAGTILTAVFLLRQAGWMNSDPGLPLGLRWLAPVDAAAYFAHAVIQEIGSRGVIQGAVVRFIGRDRLPLALSVVSVTFGVVHLHLGLTVAALTVLGSYLFGALYERHGSLVGVTLVHFVLGVVLKITGLM